MRFLGLVVRPPKLAVRPRSERKSPGQHTRDFLGMVVRPPEGDIKHTTEGYRPLGTTNGSQDRGARSGPSGSPVGRPVAWLSWIPSGSVR